MVNRQRILYAQPEGRFTKTFADDLGLQSVADDAVMAEGFVCKARSTPATMSKQLATVACCFNIVVGVDGV